MERSTAKKKNQFRISHDLVWEELFSDSCKSPSVHSSVHTYRGGWLSMNAWCASNKHIYLWLVFTRDDNSSFLEWSCLLVCGLTNGSLQWSVSSVQKRYTTIYEERSDRLSVYSRNSDMYIGLYARFSFLLQSLAYEGKSGITTITEICRFCRPFG